MPEDFEHQQDLAPGRSHLKVDRSRPSKRPVSGVQRRQLSVDDYVQGVMDHNRAILGRCITLVESRNRDHQKLARQVLTQLMPHTGKARRIGITGVPGVGKSTFIETLGCNLVDQGHRVAVLAVDPSSGVSGGSILGDKTRMAELSQRADAFIRPSPAGRTLGGVASKTRETMLICEAAGFDVMLIETVGVGQSETVVADMTDFFLALMLAGAGDELQGIKRGLLELVDMIAINKADGDNKAKARRAAGEYQNALRYMHTEDEADWAVPVLTCSAAENTGVMEIWQNIASRLDRIDADGRLSDKRKSQQLRWMWSMIDEHLGQALREHPQVREVIREIEAKVRHGEIPATVASDTILHTFLSNLTWPVQQS